MKINKTKLYTIDEFETLVSQTPVDDITQLVGLKIRWSDGEKVRSTLIKGDTLALPAKLMCARCGSYSEKQYLVTRGEGAWSVIIDEDGNKIADMLHNAYVCDDADGEFIEPEDVGFSLGGVLGRMIGIGFIIHTHNDIEEESSDTTGVFQKWPPPGWAGKEGLN